MAGDPTKAALWADADVYVGFPTTAYSDDFTATNPADADTAFGSGWSLVGLLDGDDGFTESRNEDTSDHYAWGGILMRTSRRNFKMTRSFTAFEKNDTTRRLAYPGSAVGQIVVPKPERVKLAFEMRDGATIHRLITTGTAEIEVDGDVEYNEADVASLSFVATIFPTAAGVLFTEQESAAS